MTMEQLIATLFLSREVAHREHFKTTSYAHHKTLNDFYEGIVERADAITEAFQGAYYVLEDIPILANKGKGNIADVLEGHMDEVQKLRYRACDKSDTAIQNLIDEAIELYLSTLYMLRQFK